MRIASVADVKAKFSAYLKESEGGPVVVTRNGKPVAVLLGVQDEDEIERLLVAYSPRINAILDRSREQIVKEQSFSHEEFWAHPDSEEKGTPARRRSTKAKPAE